MEMNLTKYDYSVEISGLEEESIRELIYKLDTYENELVEGIENVKILSGDKETLDYLKEHDIRSESTSDESTRVEYTLVLKLEKGDNDVNFVENAGTSNKISEINNEVFNIIKSFDSSKK